MAKKIDLRGWSLKNTGKDAYSIYGRLPKPYYVTAI